MSERSWTAEQAQAIQSRGGTLLVSAAAGSGKTAVLVERVVSMLLDEEHPVDADRLLVVTFSNAAAREMRQRIDARLAQEQAAKALQPASAPPALFNGASPYQHHSCFCLDLISKHAEELDLPADFILGGGKQAVPSPAGSGGAGNRDLLCLGRGRQFFESGRAVVRREG